MMDCNHAVMRHNGGSAVADSLRSPAYSVWERWARCIDCYTTGDVQTDRYLYGAR